MNEIRCLVPIGNCPSGFEFSCKFFVCWIRRMSGCFCILFSRLRSSLFFNCFKDCFRCQLLFWWQRVTGRNSAIGGHNLCHWWHCLSATGGTVYSNLCHWWHCFKLCHWWHCLPRFPVLIEGPFRCIPAASSGCLFQDVFDNQGAQGAGNRRSRLVRDFLEFDQGYGSLFFLPSPGFPDYCHHHRKLPGRHAGCN